MLDISVLPETPDAGDWGFVFSGRNTVTSLRAPPGMPWRLSDIESMWQDKLSPPVPIGTWEGRAAWALEVPEETLIATEHLAANLYSLLGRVEDPLFHAHGRAYQLLHWQATHRFCGRCGHATHSVEAGRALKCADCSLQVYPRVSPCVIVLVTRGERMLLAAAAGFQKRFFSTLAGFMEPGETCEEAVQREVREEVGIEVHNVRYFRSQPWPFPSQVMLGFTAEWLSGELQPEPSEIEEADWFSIDELPPTPPVASISGQLISAFSSSLDR